LHPDGLSDAEWAQAESAKGATVASEAAWTVKEALKTKPIWIMIFVYPLSMMAVFGMLAHVGAYGADVAKTVGLTLKQVAPTIGLAVMIMGLLSAASRFVSGYLSDIFGRKPLLYATFILMGLSCLYGIHFVKDMTTFIIFAAAFGFSYGLQMALWVPFLGDNYGRRSVATLWGILTFSLGIITAPASLFFGWVHDVTGSYDNAFYICIVLLVLSMFLWAMIKPISKESAVKKGEAV
jgi:OFA family oxalate/formate antiporter-like MFS transporter